jgi:hypothetical protein
MGRAGADFEGKGVTARLDKTLACAYRPCSLDQSVRVLTLSVEDPVKYIEGRRMARKISQPRWLDDYNFPGQKVDVALENSSPVAAILASSPSATRRESANLDATIVELLLDNSESTSALFAAEPGCLVDISNVHGSGFVSPVNPAVTLTSVLEVRPLQLPRPTSLSRRQFQHLFIVGTNLNQFQTISNIFNSFQFISRSSRKRSQLLTCRLSLLTSRQYFAS